MRFRRRPLFRRVLRPRLHPFRRRLRQAHRWMETGRESDAAESFAELGKIALDHERPIASQLFLQAGRAYLAAGKFARAEAALNEGIRLMVDQSDPRLGPVAKRLTADLRRSGQPDLAVEIERMLPASAAGETHAAPPGPGLDELPAKCPYCGGSVHSDQVDRTDPARPACAYCGSPLVGDGLGDD